MRLTGSKLYLADACPASHVLPASYSPAGDAADIGTAIHAYLETGAVNGHAERCECIDLSKARPVSSGIDEREVSFAYDVMTGAVRRLGIGLAREYGTLADTEIACTLDRVWQSDVIEVDDYKTGHEAPDAAGNLQLGLGAICVSTHLHVDPVATSIVHIHEDGRVWRDRVVLDVFDLEEVARRLRVTWQRVQNADGTTTHPGEHCRYCPALAACPAHAGIVKRFADLDTDALTVEQIGVAWEQLAAAQKWLEQVERSIKLRIDREGAVPLPGGGVVRPVQTTRASVVTDAAWPVLTELGIDPSKISETKIGIGDVEKSAKALGVKDIRARLIAADALKLSSSTSYRKAKS